jgi:hypothetical protein
VRCPSDRAAHLKKIVRRGRLRLTYNLQPASKPGTSGPGRFIGIFSGLKLGASADAMQFFYDEYTLAGAEIGNARAYILGLNLSALF